MENDEKSLMERLIRGDEFAFRDVVEQNKKKIFYRLLNAIVN